MVSPESPRGRVFNLQRFSLQDGPGLRTTVFLKGCPLACSWCHNPESQRPEPELSRRPERCLHCGACEVACGHRGSACVACGACAEACPSEARQMTGREVDTATLLSELLRDRIFFDQSGGGVTLSGGEPLMQPAFAGALMEGLRREGVHVALDTCGFGRGTDLLALAALADLVLFDLKLADSCRHEAATGEGNELILANLAALSKVHPRIRIRVPIIPGINDDAENLEATARIIAETPGIEAVDLLPYHASGAPKFAGLGLTYALSTVRPPSPAHMASAAAVFQSHGLIVTLGGQS